MKGKIPSNINIDKLLQDVKGKGGKPLRIDGKQRLKEGMIYFLSRLVFNPYDEKKRVDGYKILNNETLEKIIGQRLPTKISNILQVHNIIEILPYSNIYEKKDEEKDKKKEIRSTGYRLTQKYCTGKYKFVEYSDRITQRIEQYQNQVDSYETDDLNLENNNYTTPEYPYLEEQFQRYKLTIRTHESFQQLRNLIIPLVEKSLRKRNYKTETSVTLLNLIGGYKKDLDDIRNEDFNPYLIPSNHRFNSIVTVLKKEFRQFLRLDGEPLVEVDIKSSQPFILSTIFNEDFSTSTENGYNVHTIYPKLYYNFQNLKNHNNLTTSTSESTYLLGVFFSPSELSNLQFFINYDFNNDFYEYILNESDLTLDNQKEYSRDDVKDVTMKYLFDRNEINKSNNRIIQQIETLFPELSDFVRNFLRMYNKTEFSYLLQRTESFLVLNKICGYINENHPNIPFLTIHDSILTTKNHSEQVKNIMIDSIYQNTGKRPVVTIKEPSDNIDITKTWKKVNITYDKKFDRRKFTITKTNIQKGLSLMKDHGLKTQVKEVIQPFMVKY